MSRRLLVLGWHGIEPSWAFPAMTAEKRRAVFARQVRYLRRWTTVVPLRAALQDLAAGRPLPPRAVALTFDDGYLDNATVAAPLLQAAGLPATFFLVPGFLSGTARVWWEELGWAFVHATAPQLLWDGHRYDTSTEEGRRTAMAPVADALKTVPRAQREDAVDELRSRLRPEGPGQGPGRLFMDWEEARRLPALGHDVQSHTCTHPILSTEEPDTQAHELGAARRDLEAWFQRPVDVLAYPNGRPQDQSAVTRRLAAEAGYTSAVTTSNGIATPGTPRLEVPRVLVETDTDERELLRRTLRVVKRGVTAVLPHR